jgi:ubiquinone/menaquinone biosynthesis C-methylase UbiE
MTTIFEEYRNQSTWRNWESYLDLLPLERNQVILDLGCNIGIVTNLLAKRVKKVIGVDINQDFISEAKATADMKNIDFINADLRNLAEKNLPVVDGIWTSFTIAYFPELDEVLKSWLKLLNPNGWIAIVEISDLFGHYPISEDTRRMFEQYYYRQRINGSYDFEMGQKISGVLKANNLEIILDQNKYDKELSFDGQAEMAIVSAWESRLNRMSVFQKFIGDANFLKVKDEFLNCIKNETHTCNATVNFLIARKNYA